MKRPFFLVIIFIVIGLHFVSAQSMEELEKLGEDFSSGKITYTEYLLGLSALVENQYLLTNPDAKSDPSQLITASGKAWVNQDNNIQGRGNAFVLNADGSCAFYERALGIWRPYRNIHPEYTATGYRLRIAGDDYAYAISNDGSTLTLSDGRWPFDGTYTLRDLPKVQAPGGDIVNSAGTAWTFDSVGNNGTAHDIFNSDGIQYCFGGSGLGPWQFAERGKNNGSWYSYKANSSTGKLTHSYWDKHEPDTLNYSVTDFGGGNSTLRIWKDDVDIDYVYKLVRTPSGFRLPDVK
ncbi:hypothetical protein K7I13_13215 [Brucepastera parasyntrophica]|uniref:hypothetical protein n=1 Tax=Brucepastera parasyntrophica TaxID=2880008 RepID=UPI00210C2A7F|nr:hypothetical protein [Brucepastera parasyntrophica]ULQ59423.1 hypothetical protein K7I13_13215 [Brucepastera parasyntrophica]